MLLSDLILMIFYLILAYAVAYVVYSLKKNDSRYQNYFLKGLTAKMIGGIGFALVYTYYYTYGGDTMAYYGDAARITNYIFNSPLDGIRFLFDPESVSTAESKDVIQKLRLQYNGSEFPVVRTAAILNILGMNSYFSTTIIFAFLSYLGIWHFFLVFAKRYPKIEKQLAYAIFFVPSVFFWGSGIMKDSLVIGYLGMMLYAIDKFQEKGTSKLLWLLLLLYFGYVIFSTKAYVIMALAPAIIVWVVLNFKDRIANPVLRAIVVPFLLTISVIGVAGAVQVLGQYQSKYSLDNFLSTAHGMQTWHYLESGNLGGGYGRGSSYTLGEYDPTLLGTLKVFPAAVNVTMFRPYFWEANSVAMLAGAIESFVILMISIFIFIGLGFFRVIKLLMKDPFLLMAITFALFFAFAVGFTSYNFGALVRYKIPCIPFYLCGMLILNHKVKEIKLMNRMRLKQIVYGSKEETSTNPKVAAE
jgi:hypothetical protein